MTGTSTEPQVDIRHGVWELTTERGTPHLIAFVDTWMRRQLRRGGRSSSGVATPRSSDR